jgi:hypothetical protein
MPAIVLGTVVRWVVDWYCETPTVNYCSSKEVSAYVPDGSDGSNDRSVLIAKYILESEDEDKEDLLEDALYGLLQAIEIRRVPVVRPSVPPEAPCDDDDDEADAKPRKRKKRTARTARKRAGEEGKES